MKKFLNLMLVMLLMSFTIGTVAHASENNSTNYDAVINKVESANNEINLEINKAIIKGDKIVNEYAEKLSKLDINDEATAALNQKMNMDLDKIIEDLITTTNRIALNTVEFAASYGITVQCELIEVQIGNRNVLIDPLRILGD